MKPEIRNILEQQLPPEFTLQEASSVLDSQYRSPEKLLEKLVKNNELLRLKRGLYVLPDQYEPLAAAGSIGRPSYVSFETALAFYELIPERVFHVYSVIDGRPFEHAVSDVRYVYRSQNRELFAKGMTSIKLRNRSVLFATKEKALFDTLAYKSLKTDELSLDDIFKFVEQDLRIERDSLMKFSLDTMDMIAGLYRNRAPFLFTQALKGKGKKIEEKR